MRADAAVNRIRILQATIDAVGEDGVGAPTAEIAERAGVGVATVYRHFPDRRRLLASSSVWGWERFDGFYRAQLREPPSRHGVRRALERSVRIVVEGRDYLLATGEQVGRTPVEILPVKAIAERRFAALVARAERAGELRVDDVQPADVLDLALSIREPERAAGRLDLLMRALTPPRA